MHLTRLKALRQLGFQQASLYAWYQWGLKSGYLRWRTKKPARLSGIRLGKFLPLPDPEQLRKLLGGDGLSLLFAEGDEIISGKVRLFGGEAVGLELRPPGPLLHWTRCHESQIEGQRDIKLIWEPARFGWAITLARAYFLSQDERYANAFWKFTDIFLSSNPAYLGLNWVSAQEVALRLTSLVFAYQIFADSAYSNPEQVSRLAESIAQHASRIPPTLAYARAQNNNHLLTEAMGLITAARALSEHSSAKKWLTLGWKWFQQGLQAQISADGSYNQHSTNYHRLMLQTALWVFLLANSVGDPFPERSLKQLAAATHWLQSLLDSLSGGVPNLGPNDGAYIFPLSVLPFQDFRPVIQAAGTAFLGEKTLPNGIWDEMSLWLCAKHDPASPIPRDQNPQSMKYESLGSKNPSPLVLKSSSQSWAYLRAAHFSSRPGHADQLHLDLWWRGLNIALDPGTYLYNAPTPWENALTSTFVHNTITIGKQEQMSRASRFLYLDWAQGETLYRDYAQDGRLVRAVARHNGYHRLGIIHQRTVTAVSVGWRIEDLILPVKPVPESIRVRLHWLVPDWSWKIMSGEAEATLELLSPFGSIGLKIWLEQPPKEPDFAANFSVELVRAGQVLYPLENASKPTNPTWGWVSPTYGVKIPALSFSVNCCGSLPMTLITNWQLPED